jgi:plastocyanin
MIAFSLGLLVVASPLPTRANGLDGPAVPERQEHVEARENYFLPSSVTVRRGGTVVWDWTGNATHNAVDDTGMQLFDSGLTPPGGPSYSFTFEAAGSYHYVCSLHQGMAGRVEVPIKATAAKDSLTVVWSAGGLPDGFVFDVQVRRAGHGWRSWLRGSTELRDTYVAGDGSYRFRARLRLAATGASSDWSEADRVILG